MGRRKIKERKEERKGNTFIYQRRLYTSFTWKLIEITIPSSLFYPYLFLLENSPLFRYNDFGSTALIGVTIARDNLNPCITVISVQVSHELYME